MRSEALFLNGVWADVLDDILKIQAHLPEHIMYLQPYSSRRIASFVDNSPSVDDPVRLLMSVTDDLATVHYVCEIVGWDDKSKIPHPKRRLLNRLVYSFQWTDDGIYMESNGKPCVNLLYVRRMRKLSKPFSVAELTLTSTGKPHSPDRTTAGGWSYVVNPSDEWLADYL